MTQTETKFDAGAAENNGGIRERVDEHGNIVIEIDDDSDVAQESAENQSENFRKLEIFMKNEAEKLGLCLYTAERHDASLENIQTEESSDGNLDPEVLSMLHQEVKRLGVEVNDGIHERVEEHERIKQFNEMAARTEVLERSVTELTKSLIRVSNELCQKVNSCMDKFDTTKEVRSLKKQLKASEEENNKLINEIGGLRQTNHGLRCKLTLSKKMTQRKK